MAALIATLLDAGWDPFLPDQWCDALGTEWHLTDDPVDLIALEKNINEVLNLRQWQQASSHHLGAGLESGCYLPQAQAALRKLGNDDIKSQGLMRCIMCVGLWTVERCNYNGYPSNKLCPMCGKAKDTEEHRAYYCPVVEASKDEQLRATDHIVHLGQQGAADCPAFWLRGLIPKSWLPSNPFPQQCHVMAVGIFINIQLGQVSPLDVGGMSLFLDESGGAYSSCPFLRRCGWGIDVINDNYEFVGGVYSGLPGDQQTAARAGLEALWFWLPILAEMPRCSLTASTL